MYKNEKLYEVIVGGNEVKIVCRRVNKLFQDIKTNCVYGSSVISFKEID